MMFETREPGHGNETHRQHKTFALCGIFSFGSSKADETALHLTHGWSRMTLHIVCQVACLLLLFGPALGRPEPNFVCT